MYLAGGVMGATSFGGSITAILINTPGTAPNAATTFDGYPLAQQGKAGLAIGASATASALGGLIGLFTLLLFIPLAKEVVLALRAGRVLPADHAGPDGDRRVGARQAAARADRRRLRPDARLRRVGHASPAGIRFTVGMRLPVGRDSAGADADRHVRHQPDDRAGAQGRRGRRRGRRLPGRSRVRRAASSSVFRHWPCCCAARPSARSSARSPGLGGTVASFIAYTSTVQASRNPESFGKGNIIGVIAPEIANNAKDGGSLMPTVAFGIPGSAETALFLGILVLHGIDPGPSILLDNEREIYGLIVALTMSAVGASLIGLAVRGGSC